MATHWAASYLWTLGGYIQEDERRVSGVFKNSRQSNGGNIRLGKRKGNLESDVLQTVMFSLREAWRHLTVLNSTQGMGRRWPDSKKQSRHKQEAGEGDEKKCPVLSSSQPCLASPPVTALERTSAGQPFCWAAVVSSTTAFPGPAYLNVLSQRLRIHSVLLRIYIPYEWQRIFS